MELFATGRLCLTCLGRLRSNIAAQSHIVSRAVHQQRPVTSRQQVRFNVLRRYSAQEKKEPVMGSKLKKPNQRPVNPLNWKSFAIVVGLGGAIVGYMQYLRREKELAMAKRKSQSLGKPLVGKEGFSLVDHTGKTVTDKDFLGKWILLYFGFTHCPDICPDELEKIVKVVNIIDAKPKLPNLTPVFVTLDPERDDGKAVKNYVEEFSPKMIGLTGTPEQIDKAAKSYRIYYSVGPKDEDNDYLVDHSIIIYLLNPAGELAQYYGKDKDAFAVSRSVETFMQTYEATAH